MKKYFLGISALVLSIAFSAFTKPQFSTERFRFTGANPDSESQIEDVTNWTRVSSADCPINVDDKVCEIVVDDQYYSGTGSSAELNETDPAGSDEQMIIVASESFQFKISANPNVFVNYRHVTVGTTGTRFNKDIVTVP